jgi:diadenosine tetraphosphate (Ap4A) HIT family hydrolase
MSDVDLKHWPEDFLAKKRGDGCPQCVDGSVPETEHGVRFFNTDVADGYLQRVGPTPGYSVVVFRGRHVGDPQSMTSDEHATFWTAVGRVAKAIESVYDPIHLNFQILGNRDPHVHVHIVPRFDPDPAPSMPLPEAAWIHSTALTESELAGQVHALRIAVESA